MIQKAPKLMRIDEVVVKRFLFDDKTTQIKITGPKLNDATPEDTMEFLLNGVALCAKILMQYTEDYTGKRTKRELMDFIDYMFKNRRDGGFQVKWPKGPNLPPMPPTAIK